MTKIKFEEIKKLKEIGCNNLVIADNMILGTKEGKLYLPSGEIYISLMEQIDNILNTLKEKLDDKIDNKSNSDINDLIYKAIQAKELAVSITDRFKTKGK